MDEMNREIHKKYKHFTKKYIPVPVHVSVILYFLLSVIYKFFLWSHPRNIFSINRL